jgi:hypothetical protein
MAQRFTAAIARRVADICPEFGPVLMDEPQKAELEVRASLILVAEEGGHPLSVRYEDVTYGYQD